MMTFLTTAFLISALSPASGFAPSTDELKCPARAGGDPDMPNAVVLLDHEVYDGDVNDLMAMSDDIASVNVVCWRWVELNYGVKVRGGGSYVLTNGWIEQTRRDRTAALEALVAAQDRYRERTGEYAARIEELADFGALSDHSLPYYLVLNMSTTADGWQARLEPKKDWSVGNHEPIHTIYRCFAFAGEMPARWEKMRRDGGPGPVERKPECYESGTLVRSVRIG